MLLRGILYTHLNERRETGAEHCGFTEKAKLLTVTTQDQDYTLNIKFYSC